MVDAIELLVIAFVLDDVAVTFQLGSFTKGLVGSASFCGEKYNHGSLCVAPAGIVGARFKG